MKRLIAASLLFATLLLALPACAKAPAVTTPPATSPGGNTPLPTGNQTTVPGSTDKPGIGDPAPALQLVDMTGKTVSLADFKGQIVWLNFWATW